MSDHLERRREEVVQKLAAAEQRARQRREEAVRQLIAAERQRRLLLVSRILLIAAVVVNIPGILFLGDLASVIAASACTLVALFNVAVVSPRSRRLVADRRSRFRHVQQEYDDVFTRMIDFEQGESGPQDPIEAARERADEVERSVDEGYRAIERAHGATDIASVVFHCPVCAAPGHRAGSGDHDVAVPPGHERHIIGDNETWIVCHSAGEPRLWRYDPNA